MRLRTLNKVWNLGYEALIVPSPHLNTVYKSPGWYFTLRSMASDFCRSKFRAEGRWGWGRDKGRTRLLCPASSKSNGGAWGLGQICFFLPFLRLVKFKLVWSDSASQRLSQIFGDPGPLVVPPSSTPHLSPHLGANEEENSHQGLAGRAAHPGHFLGTEKRYS